MLETAARRGGSARRGQMASGGGTGELRLLDMYHLPPGKSPPARPDARLRDGLHYVLHAQPQQVCSSALPDFLLQRPAKLILNMLRF